MSNFTLLLFGWDDQVLGVQSLQTPNAADARRMAEALVDGHHEAAGWQLWQGGHKIHATFPESKARRPFLRLVPTGLAG